MTAGTGGEALKIRMLERPEVIDELLASRRLFDTIFDHSSDLTDGGVFIPRLCRPGEPIGERPA